MDSTLPLRRLDGARTMGLGTSETTLSPGKVVVASTPGLRRKGHRALYSGYLRQQQHTSRHAQLKRWS